jgi:hypothetical protein
MVTCAKYLFGMPNSSARREKMKIYIALAMCCTYLCYAGNTGSDKISIVSLDKHGKEKIVEVERHRYIQMNTKIMNLVQKLQLPELEKVPKKWELSQIRVGLGVGGEVGIGPYQVGMALNQRFVFKKGAR